jgi:hypothetical protein
MMSDVLSDVLRDDRLSDVLSDDRLFILCNLIMFKELVVESTAAHSAGCGRAHGVESTACLSEWCKET